MFISLIVLKQPKKNVYSHNFTETKMFISLIVLKQTVFQLQFSFQTAWEPLVHISVHRQRESIPKSFENKLKNRLPWIHPLIANHKSWILFYWSSSLQPEGSPVLWLAAFCDWTFSRFYHKRSTADLPSHLIPNQPRSSNARLYTWQKNFNPKSNLKSELGLQTFRNQNPLDWKLTKKLT